MDRAVIVISLPWSQDRMDWPRILTRSSESQRPAHPELGHAPPSKNDPTAEPGLTYAFDKCVARLAASPLSKSRVLASGGAASNAA